MEFNVSRQPFMHFDHVILSKVLQIFDLFGLNGSIYTHISHLTLKTFKYIFLHRHWLKLTAQCWSLSDLTFSIFPLEF